MEVQKLSLKGKIIIIKTLILPQVQFLFSMLYVADNLLNRIDKMLFNFLWDNKPHKIKRSTIIASIEEGGLNMVDVYSVHLASKCAWIRRLINNTKGKWKEAMWVMLNTNKVILNKNINF